MKNKRVLASYVHLPGLLHMVTSDLSDLVVNEVLDFSENFFFC